MTISKGKYVTRPDGTLLTPGSLPPPDTQRWVVSRKADVVMAVEGGILTANEACSRYRLTLEEFGEWQKAFKRFGLRGLKVTAKLSSDARSRPKDETTAANIGVSRQ